MSQIKEIRFIYDDKELILENEEAEKYLKNVDTLKAFADPNNANVFSSNPVTFIEKHTLLNDIKIVEEKVTTEVHKVEDELKKVEENVANTVKNDIDAVKTDINKVEEKVSKITSKKSS